MKRAEVGVLVVFEKYMTLLYIIHFKSHREVAIIFVFSLDNKMHFWLVQRNLITAKSNPGLHPGRHSPNPVLLPIPFLERTLPMALWTFGGVFLVDRHIPFS